MKIINFGSLNIDYVYSVDHIVREGETIPGVFERFLGGKGLNQSIALSRAGANAFHAGFIGEDGGALKSLLIENGVDTAFVRPSAIPNGHALIQVDAKGQNSIIVFGGANGAYDERFIDEVCGTLEKGDWALTQNETNLTVYMARKAKERGAKLCLNPSPISAEMLEDFPFETVDCFVLNETEGAALSGAGGGDYGAVLSALTRRFPAAEVVLTAGKDGAFYGKDSERLFQPAFEVVAADTTAAGDTFLGFFLGGRANGKDAAQCLREASAAAALAVSVKGAGNSIPHMADTLRFLQNAFKNQHIVKATEKRGLHAASTIIPR